MSRHRILPALAAVMTLACGPSPSTCVPGEQISCACPGGSSGVQRCDDSGRYGECACGDPIDASVSDAAALDASSADAGGGDAGGRGDGGAGSDAGRDGGPPGPCDDQLDLLLMIDNSNSMAEEQASLTSELPRLVRALATGDVDADGTAEFTPIASLHVGIVTSDMGVGGNTVPTCGNGSFGFMHGDDGVLLGRGNTAIPGCGSSYPPVFQLGAGDDRDAFASEVACVATTGTGGCGFEQQLEAVLKAVSPASPQPWTAAGYAPPTFFDDTTGHATGANAGFVREGSILAALVVTDEEDCSAIDPELFDPTAPEYSGSDLNLRCFTYPSAQHPISRFVTGLAGLRRDPARLVFSVIAGVPEDLSGASVAEYDAILADPRMIEEVETSSSGSRIRPSCSVPGRGVAFPPRRIVGVASGLDAAGAQTSVESICRASFSPAIDALLASIASAASSCP